MSSSVSVAKTDSATKLSEEGNTPSEISSLTEEPKNEDETESLLGSSKIEASPKRFLVYGLFLLINLIAGYSINLVQSAESTAEAAYPGLSVNMLSTIQLASQVPGMLLEPFLLEGLGMRNLSIAMAFCQLVGYSCIGGLPFFLVNKVALLLYIGNAFIGFSAGVMLIPIAKMVTTWMKDDERDAALALGLNAGNIGTGIGYFLVQFLAGSNHVTLSKVPAGHIHAMHTYLNYLPILPAVSLIAVISFMENQPVYPPSIAASEQRQADKDDPDKSTIEDLLEPWVAWRADLKSVGADGFVISVLVFGSLQVAIYTTATFIPEIMLGFDFSYGNVAFMGAGFFFLNTFGAIFLSTLAYRFMSPIKAAVALSSCVVLLQVGCCLTILYNVSGMAYLSHLILLALIAAPAQAVACDFGCNTMFPINENSIMFWQLVVGQSFAAVFNVLFAMTRTWSSPVPYAYGYILEVGLLVVAIFGCMLWKGKYKRDEQEVDNLKAPHEEEAVMDQIRQSIDATIEFDPNKSEPMQRNAK